MQQIIELPLNGVTTTPSDYASPDGDLAFTSGVTNTKGSWQPLPYAKVKGQVLDGYELAYIHETSSGRNYILRNATGLCFMREGQTSVVEGNVDEAERAALYAQYVAPHDGILRSINEQIMVKQQQLSLVGDETEADLKLREFVTKVNTILLPYITAYDANNNNTVKRDEWDAMNAVEKFGAIEHDWHKTVIFCEGSPIQYQLCSTVHPAWWKRETDAGNFVIGWQDKNNVTSPPTPAKAGYGFLLIDEDREVILGNINNALLTDEHYDGLPFSQLLQEGENFLDNTYEVFNEHLDVVVGGSLSDVNSMANDSWAIDMLDDEYWRYYHIIETADKQTIQAELDALLNDLETATANRAADYALYENAIANIPKYIYKGSVKQIVNMGNVLTVLSDNPIHNLIWKDGDYLDFAIPEDPIIRFELNGEYVIDNIGDIHYTKSLYANYEFKKFITRKVVDIHDLPTSREHYHVIPPKSFTQNVRYKTIFNFDFSSALPNDIYIDNPDYDENYAEENGLSRYLHGHFEYAEVELEFGIVYENNQYEAYKSEHIRINKKYSTSGIFVAQDDVHNFVIKGTIKPYYLDDNEEWLDIPNKTIRELCESFTYEVLTSVETGTSYVVGRDSVPTILEKINTFIKENATDANKFMFPFFLRYGYEMYDGSISYLSAPILMLPNTGNTPSLYIKDFEASANEATKSTDIASVVSKIMFTILDADKLQTLKHSSSVVKNIVFAITTENYTFDDAFKADGDKAIGIEYASDIDKADEQNWSYVRLADELFSEQITFAARYGSNSLYKQYMQESSMARIILPKNDDSKFRKGVENNSTYYIVKKIPVEELTTATTELEFDEGTLSSLTSRTVLDSSLVTCNKISASTAMVYNRRLNLANIKETIMQGWNPATLMTYSRGYTNNVSNNDGTIYYRMILHCNYEGNSYNVDVPYSVSNDTPLSWIFYYLPVSSVDVYKIVGNYAYKATIVTKEHPFLNGYYALANSFDGFEFKQLSSLEANAEIIRKNSIDSESSSVVVPYKNKLYLSKVSDPLTFDLSSTIFVGNGTILALSTANRPISEGQFGQYPLYAFTTHGVWALEINADGTYSAPKPITRDVVTNVGSITQIDDAVVFVTERGLMLLSGGQSVCLSDDIDETTTIHVPTSAITGSNIDVTINPKQLLQTCSIVYDYVNQRLICHSSEKKNGTRVHPYALVYSIKNKQWSYIVNDIAYSVSSYPETLVVDNNGNIRDMSNTDVANSTTAIIYTRPFRLTDVDYKSINEVRINGVINFEQVKVILQASNDLLQWQSIASSATNSIQNKAGTPYRFFRLLIYATLAPTHSLSSASIKFTAKDDGNIISH